MELTALLTHVCRLLPIAFEISGRRSRLKSSSPYAEYCLVTFLPAAWPENSNTIGIMSMKKTLHLLLTTMTLVGILILPLATLLLTHLPFEAEGSGSNPSNNILSTLALLWELDSSRSTLNLLLVSSFLALTLGCFFILKPYFLTPAFAPNKVRAAKINLTKSVGVGLLFYGLSSVYAIICPPFQAADEPDHLLSYAQITGRPDLTTGALRLASRTDFKRIKSSPLEILKSEDIDDQTTTAPWPSHVSPPWVEDRSILTFYLWKATEAILPEKWSTAMTLLVLRLINCGCFAVVGVIGTGFATLRNQDGLAVPGASSLGVYSFAGITTLPFFAMHFSNYATLTALLLGQAILLQTLIVRPRLYSSDALLLGLLLSLALLVSIPSVALVGFWMVFLSVLIAVAPRSLTVSTDTKQVANFVCCLWLPAILSALLFYDTVYFKLLLGTIGRGVLPLLELNSIVDSPIRLTGLLTVFSVLLVATVIFAIGLRLVTGYPKVVRSIKGSQPYLIGAGIGSLLVIFLGFTIWPAPSVPDIETVHNISLVNYFAKVIGAFLSSFGLSSSDLYIVRSFWTGFGWLEWMPHGWVYHLLTTTVLVGIFLLWVSLYWDQNNPARLWLVIGTTLGLGLYLTLLIHGSYYRQFNLHGRYLIGFYLFTVTLAGAGMWRLENLFRRLIWYRMVRLLNFGLLLFLLSVHSYLIGALILRYYGLTI